MTSRYKNRHGAYVIPKDQLKEFFNGLIDYNKLISDCMVSINQKEAARNYENKSVSNRSQKKKGMFSRD